MPVFAWSGLSAAGKEVKGVRDAESPKALRAVLKREGVFVEQVTEAAEAKKRSAREVDFGKYFRRVSAFDLSITTKQLATLLKAGIPLVESISAIIEQLEHPELKLALTSVRDKVNEGTSLADALRAHPKIFGVLYVNMVAAGEASGTLELVLARLSDFLDSQAKLQNKVLTAAAYPAFMGFVSVAVIIILMAGVVPNIKSIFDNFQRALPWYTRVLIFASDAIRGYWWLLIVLVGGAVYGFRRWFKTTKGRSAFDRRILTLPLIGQIAIMVAVARFSRTLATLLKSGVPVLTALEITRNVLGNTELQRVIDDARGSIREGDSIAAPLKRSGRFPPIVTHMIAIGERSGQLEEMLESVANAYDTQVETRLVGLTALMEPIMIVTLGLMAGGIVIAIMTPLLEISSFVQ